MKMILLSATGFLSLQVFRKQCRIDVDVDFRPGRVRMGSFICRQDLITSKRMYMHRRKQRSGACFYGSHLPSFNEQECFSYRTEKLVGTKKWLGFCLFLLSQHNFLLQRAVHMHQLTTHMFRSRESKLPVQRLIFDGGIDDIFRSIE